MIDGKKCEECRGTGDVKNPGYDDAGFSPPKMPCYVCGGMGTIQPQPQNIEEAAVLLAEALEIATRAKTEYQSKLNLYSRWKMGACKDEDGRRL